MMMIIRLKLHKREKGSENSWKSIVTSELYATSVKCITVRQTFNSIHSIIWFSL